jgi:hypothetical protein
MTPVTGRVLTGTALVGMLALAGGLRLQGLGFGLPAVYNPDEIAIMSRALAFAKGDLNPHNFLYPTFYFYALFAWIGAYFAGAWATGAVPSAAVFQSQFFVDPTGIYLAGRLLGVVCGVATVGALYALGRRLFDVPTGLVAALFLAVAPTAVRDAHYVKHDVPVTLAIVLAYLAIARVASSDLREPGGRSRKPLFVAAALCGAAFSTHYYAVFLALPLMLAIGLAHASNGWRAIVRELAIAGLVGSAVFLALSPFLLVEPATAWQDIVANRQIVMDRAVADGRGAFASAPAYAHLLWSEGIGWPVVLGALLGLAVVAREQPRNAALLLAFPLPFLAFISNTVAASRYLNPVLPFIALLAAVAVCRLAGRARSETGRRRQWITVGAALLLAIPGLRLSFDIGRFFQQTDTRTLAQRFIESTIPAGATVLVQPYSVQLTQSKASLREALAATGHDPARATGKFAMRLALDPEPSPAYRTLFLGDGGLDADKIYVSPRALGAPAPDSPPPDSPDALEPLRRLGVQYVVLKRYNTEDLPVAPLRAELRARGRLLAEFSPWRLESANDGADARARALVAPFLHNTDTPYDRALERPGPGIEVWAIGEGPDTSRVQGP